MLLLPFLHPGASLGVKNEFLCQIGEMALEGRRWIQGVSAGNWRGEFLNSCVSKRGNFSSFFFAFSRILPKTF